MSNEPETCSLVSFVVAAAAPLPFAALSPDVSAQPASKRGAVPARV